MCACYNIVLPLTVLRCLYLVETDYAVIIVLFSQNSVQRCNHIL